MPTTRECLGCGTDISDRHGNARYCRECYEAQEKQHQANRARPALCPQCGAAFSAKTGREKYCTLRCSGLAARARQLGQPWTAICVVCASAFSAADTRMITCSVRCRIYHRRHPEYVDVERQCEVCARGIPRDTHRAAIYCSERCRRLIGKHLRRNRAAQAPAEPVRLRDVFERDGWICHICSLPVDRELNGHHPMMASLDHIIPISDPEYPGHVWANLALAHLICNTSKCNRATQKDRDLYERLRAIKR
ncbi:gp100 [Streptomyces viridosporus ATCC 14672]|uniref:Gp100 n=1 Tax=Streptomyces viridosporus (strain ATCC 14672 / DSM 40746 / JCM 4963 / KCTC 9882 / NRRL B-12104 / FH 1290) TaxID=566461 RepID=D6A4C9_STRV1|nr:gp100 [Streptomyces viridosporus ATCC 14672]